MDRQTRKLGRSPRAESRTGVQATMSTSLAGGHSDRERPPKDRAPGDWWRPDRQKTELPKANGCQGGSETDGLQAGTTQTDRQPGSQSGSTEKKAPQPGGCTDASKAPHDQRGRKTAEGWTGCEERRRPCMPIDFTHAAPCLGHPRPLWRGAVAVSKALNTPTLAESRRSVISRWLPGDNREV